MRALIAGTLAVLLTCAASAQEEEESRRVFDMNPGSSLFLDVEGVENAIVGDDKVLTVVPVAQNKVAITALKDGFSSVVFVDANGNSISQADITVKSGEQSEVIRHVFDMYPGVVIILPVEGQLAEGNVIVGDDEVLTVVPVGQNKVAITALRDGFSSLVFVDADGNTISRAEITVKSGEQGPPADPAILVSVEEHRATVAGRLTKNYFCRLASGCGSSKFNPTLQPVQPIVVAPNLTSMPGTGGPIEAAPPAPAPAPVYGP
jgi:hypothetical protein